MIRLILLCGLGLPGMAGAAGCDASIGVWKWFNGGSVTLTPQKTVLMNGKPAGKWECADANKGTTVIRWTAGFVDTVTVGGNRMTGKNQQGVAVSADRQTAPSHK